MIASLVLMFSTNALAKEYTFGVVPQQSSKKLARLWTPVLQKINSDTGLSIKFATAKDIPTFEKRLAEGRYDFAYMNPYHFTVFNDSPGYVALAHQKDKRIKGIIVVRNDSTLTSLQDLNGQTLAFPSPAAFSATILPSANLILQDVEFQPKYVSSHDSVYLAVARGLLPAGGGIVRTFNNTDPEVRESLRILWTSEGYTPHAFAAHPDVPDHDRFVLATALSELYDSEEGVELMNKLNIGAIQLAEDSDWNDVRALQITELSSDE